MYTNRDSCQLDVIESRRSQINTIWSKESRYKNTEFNSGLTFNSRWLFPFAKLAASKPKLVGKFIFLSNTSWFTPFFNRVTITDCMKLVTDPFFVRRMERPDDLRIHYPQSLRYMRKVLGVEDKLNNEQIKDSLFQLFRTPSLWTNIYSYWDPPYHFPCVNIDVFLKIDTVPNHPNLIKVCIGGVCRLNASYLIELAVKLKFFNKKELGFHNDPIVNFYKKLYMDRIHIFTEEELPWGLIEENDSFLVPIMSSYVDLDREVFLQETILGKALFSLYLFGRYKDKSTNLFFRRDIPGLEARMATRFPTLMDALICGEIPPQPILC